MSFQSTKVLK